jgi:hypothetical protein
LAIAVLSCALLMVSLLTSLHPAQAAAADLNGVSAADVANATFAWVNESVIAVTIGGQTINFTDPSGVQDWVGTTPARYFDNSTCSQSVIWAAAKQPGKIAHGYIYYNQGSPNGKCTKHDIPNNIGAGQTDKADITYNINGTTIQRVDGAKWYTFNRSGNNPNIYHMAKQGNQTSCFDVVVVTPGSDHATLWELSPDTDPRKAPAGIEADGCFVSLLYDDVNGPALNNPNDAPGGGNQCPDARNCSDHPQNADGSFTIHLSAAAPTNPEPGNNNCITGNEAGCTAGGGAGDDDTVDCGSAGFNWIICPAIKLALTAAGWLDGFITDQLNVDVTTIFDGTDKAGSTQAGYYQAWSQFRIIATSLLVIGGLVMVASTALGFEFLDAYTIRKTLPRLLVAIIGVSLSWPLMRLCVNFFDTVGFDIRSLMYHPFQHLGGTIGVSTGILTTLLLPGIWFAFGPSGLTFLLTALLAVFVGFLILVIRQAAIIMLVILAPVAIICYILPNTQRVWKLWYENFLGLLLMFPIISALIAAGHIFAAVTIASNQGSGPKAMIAQAIALVAYFVVYFLLPLAARLATGVIGNIAGFVNDRHKGAFDRLKNIRDNGRNQRHSARMAGNTRFGRSAVGKHVYRRAGLLGTPNSGAANPFTAQGRANFNATTATNTQRAVAEALKNDNGRAANDDDSMAAAMHATSDRDFIRRWQERTGGTVAEARDALARTQSSFGVTMGSATMQAAAYHARTGSVTGYNTDVDPITGVEQGKIDMIRDAAEMVRRGYMTESDAMAAIKQNKARVDQSGISFNAGLRYIRQAGRDPGSIDQHAVDDMMDSVITGLTPGGLIGARQESGDALVRHLTRQLQGTVADAGGNLQAPEVQSLMGSIAGIRDTINSQAPQLANHFAGFMGTQVGTSGQSVRQLEEEMRRDPTAYEGFHNKRKEWLGGVPPGTPPGGGSGPVGSPPLVGAPPSDIRLKRNIVALCTTDSGIQLYRFKYLWSNQEYVGVMAQDLIHIHPEALSKDELGFYRVDYSQLGLRMMTIEEWKASRINSTSVR